MESNTIKNNNNNNNNNNDKDVSDMKDNEVNQMDNLDQNIHKENSNEEEKHTIETDIEENQNDNKDNKDNKDISTENQPTEEDIKAAWTQAWDDSSQAYYWWNTITYESSWEDPYDSSTTAVAFEYPTAGNDNDDNENKIDNNNTTTITPHEPLETYESIANTELDSVLDTIDKEVKAKLDGKKTTVTTTTTNSTYPYNTSSSLNYDHNYNYYNNNTATQYQYGTTDPYKFQAHFNTKTGRFQASQNAERFHPDQYTMEARAKRQMDHYFDVDAYQEQRNQQLRRGQKRPLSKKDVEKFKQAKKEKKLNRMRGWLRD